MHAPLHLSTKLSFICKMWLNCGECKIIYNSNTITQMHIKINDFWINANEKEIILLQKKKNIHTSIIDVFCF